MTTIHKDLMMSSKIIEMINEFRKETKGVNLARALQEGSKDMDCGLKIYMRAKDENTILDKIGTIYRSDVKNRGLKSVWVGEEFGFTCIKFSGRKLAIIPTFGE